MLHYAYDRDDFSVMGSKASECLNSSLSYTHSNFYSYLEAGPDQAKGLSQQGSCYTCMNGCMMSQAFIGPSIRCCESWVQVLWTWPLLSELREGSGSQELVTTFFRYKEIF